ncbi:hypothetical protein AABB24_026510 [Solanum stoloniferum]|uniref:Uncharacterized protein n=1 Tax=Solanum stoloniferum TaxID=62892 RepID=A0ABD2SF74_9SOLN
MLKEIGCIHAVYSSIQLIYRAGELKYKAGNRIYRLQGAKWIVYIWYTVQYTLKGTKTRPVYNNIHLVYTIGSTKKKGADLAQFCKKAQIRYFFLLPIIVYLS